MVTLTVKENKKILVTGAGGFIGKDLVSLLLERGWRVRAMIRSASSFPFIHDKNLEIMYADMREWRSLKEAVKNVCVVVHLAAAKSDERDSYEINVEGMRNLIRACREERCNRIINISTQSVKIKHKGIYAQTKLEAERILHDSGLFFTTLRPSVVYGVELSGVFGTVVNFVRKLPFVPILGDGKWICAPIYIRDLSEAIYSCIENDKTIGKVYDIAGPDLLSFDSFIDKICSELKIKRLKIHVPLRLSLTLAKTLAKLMARPPITVSNVLGSNQNTDIDITPAQNDFDFQPMGFEKGLKLVFEKIKSSSQNMLNRNGKTNDKDSDHELKNESVLLARYLIGCNPSADICNRYVEANHTILEFYNVKRNYPELVFVRRYPLSLPFIDAATGVLNPNSILRKKLLLMTALLETSPLYAEEFLQKPLKLSPLIMSTILTGLRSVLKLAVGVPLYFLFCR